MGNTHKNYFSYLSRCRNYYANVKEKKIQMGMLWDAVSSKVRLNWYCIPQLSSTSLSPTKPSISGIKKHILSIIHLSIYPSIIIYHHLSSFQNKKIEISATGFLFKKYFNRGSQNNIRNSELSQITHTYKF